MGLSKVFKAFKKGGKAASGMKKGEVASNWPSGIRIGVYGHANSGKSVFFTVLNEFCKVSKKLQIAISDTLTSGQLLGHYRNIWGMGVTSDVGTMVDLRGEKKFPEATRGDKVLQFNAILDRDTKVPVVTLDYDGKAVSINEQSELKDKVTDFMSGCDGLLIFYDPKMLGAELQTQELVASFTNVLELLAPLNKRIPIPVALVVSKADILPGFSEDEQTRLINPEDESFLSNDFEVFMEKVLSSPQVASNQAWSGTVRDILTKLREFFKVVVGRTLDFQLFFISCTGSTPEKIGTDIGRSIYAPPDKITPVGVQEPLYWLLRSVLKYRGISRVRWLAKWATILSLAWITLFSIPYLYQFAFLHSQVISGEDAVLANHFEAGGSMSSLTKRQINRISDPYRSYQNKWVVNWLFRPFKQTADQLILNYRALEKVDIEKILDNYIIAFADMAGNPSSWPVRKLDDTVFIDDDNAQRYADLIADIDALGVAESDAELARRVERVKYYLDKFKMAIINTQDKTAIWNEVNDQILLIESREDIKLTASEQALHKALRTRQQQAEQVVVTRQTGSAIGDYLKTINDNADPKFRLETVPSRLQSDLPALQRDPANRESVAKINAYMDGVQKFKTRRKYVYRLASCPDGYHVHVMVRRGKGDTAWRVGKQLWPGVSVDTVNWRMGDQIVVAVDGPDDPETWGEKSAAKKELKGRLALFDLNKGIQIGDKTITFTFVDDLEEMLPRIK
ncbi:MAG: hypothetical protein DRP45_02300 [Candidatus Zixiibacteriota bacterium]|nr:MAG: hypothetical protein DRP45_02300 [candidate division Zixibacteria bacterium]